jgi:hypothetical protein
MKSRRGARPAPSGKERDTTPAPVGDVRPAFVVLLDDNTYGVAVWVRDQAGVPVYEIRHRGIRVLKLAATLAAQEMKTLRL